MPLQAEAAWASREEYAGFDPAVLQDATLTPAPLPSNVELSMDTCGLLAEAHHSTGRLLEATRRLPDPDWLVHSTTLREARSSASWEHNHGLLEVCIAELPGVDYPPGMQPLRRYLRATQLATRLARAGHEVQLSWLGRLSRFLSEGQPLTSQAKPGRNTWLWRSQIAWLGGPTRAEAQIVHTVPGSCLEVATAQWQEWSRSLDEMKIPWLGRLAIGFHRLEIMHPFDGGNGYVARAWAAYQMIRAGLLRDPVLALSVWLDRRRDTYYGELRRVVQPDQSEDFEPFIRFFAHGVLEICADQLELIRRLEEFRDECRVTVSRRGKAAEVAETLIGHPVLNAREVARRLEITPQHAGEVLGALAADGILTEVPTAGRMRIYQCERVFEIYNDIAPAPPASDGAVFDRAPDDAVFDRDPD